MQLMDSNASTEHFHAKKLAISISSPMSETMSNKDDAASPKPEKVFYDKRTKRKNVLALNEKVAAIREYERIPVYKRVGRLFKCSPDQIKRIIQQKETILQAWEQRTRRCQNAKTLEFKAVNTSMLDKAVYEWIRRMMYYKDFMITDGLIQKIALQFKSAMGIPNFFPHQEWCDQFRSTFQIEANDSKLLNIEYTQAYSVQIKDIIKHLLSKDDEDDDFKNNNNIGSCASKKQRQQQRQNQRQVEEIPISKLQPIRQLIALPIQTSGLMGADGSGGMTQKVLLATPITPNNVQRYGCNGAPMTMTIIPLTTLTQASQPQQCVQLQTSNTTVVPSVDASARKTKNKCSTLALPVNEIKTANKKETANIPEVYIKQECISGDEVEVVLVENQQTTKPLSKPKPVAELTESPVVMWNFRPNFSDYATDYDDGKQLRSKSNEAATTTSNNSAVQFTSTTTATTTFAAEATSATCALSNKKNAEALPPIKSCLEARRYLKLLEDFALYKENYRLIGLITRADEVLRELDSDNEVDID